MDLESDRPGFQFFNQLLLYICEPQSPHLQKKKKSRAALFKVIYRIYSLVCEHLKGKDSLLLILVAASPLLGTSYVP